MKEITVKTVTGILLLFLASPNGHAQDTIINLPGVGADTAPPAHSLQDLLPYIEDVYGASFASGLNAAVGGPNPAIGLGEIHSPPQENGAHDKDTILVNTKDKDGREQLGAFESAMVVAHEYEHILNCGANAEFDPTTHNNPCGPCAHATMFYMQASKIHTSSCPPDPETIESVCRGMKNAYYAGVSAGSRCDAAGCPMEHSTMAAARKSAESGYSACCSN